MPAPQIFFADLVRERSSATGTGPLALSGALPGYRPFAGTVPALTLFHYAIAGVHDSAQWEAGTGRLLADGRIERLSVAASSDGGALVDFAPGLKTVALTVGAGWFAGATVPPAIADIAGLQSALDGKQAAGSYAAASHTHGIAAITSLQATLDGKQPISTGHSAATSAAATDTFVIRRGAGWLNLPLSALPFKDASGRVAIGPASATSVIHAEIASAAHWYGTYFNIPTGAALTIGNTTPGGYTCGVQGRMATSTGVLHDSFFIGSVGAGPWTNATPSTQICDLVVLIRNAASATIERLRIDGVSGAVQPGSDNAQSLGAASRRFSTIFAASGTISTSDARDKVDIGAIPDSWLDAWGAVEWQRYRFKGGTRWHVGLVAQRVHASFAGFGIDAFAIGLLCRDAIKGARGRKDRWGLRYDECLAIEAAWQRREIARLSARLAKRRLRKVAA